MSFINSYKPPVQPSKEELRATLLEPYDVNSCIPVPTILETDRIALVPFVPAQHAEKFCDVFLGNPDIQRYLPFSFGTTFEEFLVFLEFLRQWDKAALFAIIDKTRPSTATGQQPAGQIAGIIGWVHADLEHRVLEIGPVIVLPEFQGTFVSANAIGLLLKYALDRQDKGGLCYRRVEWTADPRNAKSVGVAEKMGFTREGVKQWLWILPVGRDGREAEEGRGNGNGRDTLFLSLCWDRWVSGVRDEVEKRMARS